jgi:uncharacterized membrane protein
MKKFLKIIPKTTFLIMGCVLVLSTCTKDKTPAPVEPCDPNKVYFTNDIQPFINSSCAKSGCHDAITQAEGLNLSTYNGVMEIVKPKNPGGSEIMEVVNSTDPGKMMPPPGNTPLTQEQKNLLSRWISEGAINQTCIKDTGSCVTGVVSYSATISKIMSANCTGCHSGSNLGGGFDLSNYTGVKACANTGKLYNSVAQNGQASAMPKGGAKLPSCDITKIKSWIDAGTPNN